METLRPNSIVSNTGWSSSSGILLNDILGATDYRFDADQTEFATGGGFGGNELVIEFEDQTSGLNTTKIKLYVFGGYGDVTGEISFDNGSSWGATTDVIVSRTGVGWTGFTVTGTWSQSQINNLQLRLVGAGPVYDVYIETFQSDLIVMYPNGDDIPLDWTPVGTGSAHWDKLSSSEDLEEPSTDSADFTTPHLESGSVLDVQDVLRFGSTSFTGSAAYLDLVFCVGSFVAPNPISVRISIDNGFSWTTSEGLNFSNIGGYGSWSAVRFTGPFSSSDVSGLYVEITQDSAPPESVQIYSMQLRVPIPSTAAIARSLTSTLTLTSFCTLVRSYLETLSDTLTITDTARYPQVFTIGVGNTLVFNQSEHDNFRRIPTTNNLIFTDLVSFHINPNRQKLATPLVLVDSDHENLYKVTILDPFIINDNVRPNRFQESFIDNIDIQDQVTYQDNHQFVDDLLDLDDLASGRWRIYNARITEDFLTFFEIPKLGVHLYNARFTDILTIVDSAHRTFYASLTDTLVISDIVERIKYAEADSVIVFNDTLLYDLRHLASNTLTFHELLCFKFSGTIHLTDTLVLGSKVARVIDASPDDGGPTSFNIVYVKQVFDFINLKDNFGRVGGNDGDCAIVVIGVGGWRGMDEPEWELLTEPEWLALIEG